MAADHPEIPNASPCEYLTYETDDPQSWTAAGYVVVQVDSRGTGALPGHLEIFPPQETATATRRSNGPAHRRGRHPHDTPSPVEPGVVYEVDVEIWPTGMHIPLGHRIALTIGGSDFTRPGQPGAHASLFFHTDAADRPTDTFAGITTLHLGSDHPNTVLLPKSPT